MCVFDWNASVPDSLPYSRNAIDDSGRHRSRQNEKNSLREGAF